MQAAPAAAVEHPNIVVTELDSMPEFGHGVANQNPGATQTPTWEVLVWDMVQSGERMYVGGGFLKVQKGENGTKHAQPFLAAFDVHTGDWVETFRPQLDRVVYALEVLPNGSILAGGEFETVNGVTRRGLVALDPETGATDPTFKGAVDRPWSDKRAMVRDLHVDQSTGHIYAVGNFSHAEGANGARTRAYKSVRFLDATGTIDTSWQPNVSGSSVWGVTHHPGLGRVAFAGYFSSVNAEPSSGYFWVVDDDTGATVPGLTPLQFHSKKFPQMYDVAYSEDRLFLAGGKHILFVLNPTTNARLGYHVTGTKDPANFGWNGGFAGGDYQAVEVFGDTVIAGCHCNDEDDNHWTSFTGRTTTRHVALAYEADTGRHIEAYDPDVSGGVDGHWAAASDINGCLWLGGDYSSAGHESGKSSWLGGFGRFCPEVAPITVYQPVPAVQSSLAGKQVTFQIDASGDDDANLRFIATGLPPGLTIDPNTGLISGTTDESGSYEITVTASDLTGAAGADSTTFSWEVLPVAQPEIIPIDDLAILEFDATTIDMATTDGRSRLAWTATGLPAGMEVDADTGQLTIDDTVPDGTYDITATATDLAGRSDSEAFTLRVINREMTGGITSIVSAKPRNSSTSYFLGWRFTVSEATDVNQLGVFDTNGNGKIDNANGTVVAIYNSNTKQELARVFLPADVEVSGDQFAYGDLADEITLEPGIPYAIASQHPSNGETFSIEVQAVISENVTVETGLKKTGTAPGYPSSTAAINGDNFKMLGPNFRHIEGGAPAIDPIADQQAIVGQPATVRFSAADPVGDGLTWSANGLPDGFSLNPNTGEVTGSATTAATSMVTVTATDSLGVSDTDTFAWMVLGAVAPQLSPIEDRSVLEFEPFAFPAPTVDNRDGITWSAVGVPNGASFNPETGELVSQGGVAGGTYDITVTATDLGGRSDSEAFTLEVANREITSAVISLPAFEPRNTSTNYFLGWRFTVSETKSVHQLGVLDTNGNGKIDNPNGTVVALYNWNTNKELARVFLPADVEVTGDQFAYGNLAQKVTLEPGVTYAIASEHPTNGERFAIIDQVGTSDGITVIGGAFKKGTAPGTPNTTRDVKFFGPNFRTIGDGLGDPDNPGDPDDPDNGGGGVEPPVSTVMLPAGSSWRYLDDGSNQGTAWTKPGFDDSTWAQDRAEFGFGDGDEATLWQTGNAAYYARTTFEFNGEQPNALLLTLAADDGAVVYLNGTEILRDNMPAGTITSSTVAATWRMAEDELAQPHVVAANALVQGTNTIAVSVHNSWAKGGDLSFDLQVEQSSQGAEAPPAGPVELIAAGAQWRYADSANGQPAGWPNGLPGGPTARAEFGFGDGDEATLLTPGLITYYFSHSFDVDDASSVGDLTLDLAADDGAVVYLNGTEILRDKMPNGTIGPNTPASAWSSGASEKFFTATVAEADIEGLLVDGSNTVTVEVHNIWTGNPDLSFDLRLVGEPG